MTTPQDLGIGPCRVVRDWSWAHGNAYVGEIETPTGARRFVKRHRDPDRFTAELRAYREWTPALGAHAPVLHAYDIDRRLLVLSRLDGAIQDDAGVAAHLHAGVLLRRFHGAASAPPGANGVAGKRERLDHWAARGGDGLIGPEVLEFARAGLDRLASLPALPMVPCHRDYTPRNWLVDGDRVNIIDFEIADLDVWVTDLGRLWFGAWRDRPDLRDAFLDGYGRTPDRSERAILFSGWAVTAIWHLVWAREHGEAGLERSSRQVLAELMERG